MNTRKGENKEKQAKTKNGLEKKNNAAIMGGTHLYIILLH